MKFLLLTTIVLIGIMQTSTREYEFQQTDPIEYKHTRITHTGGMESYNVLIHLVNPCKNYFDKLTDSKAVDKQLVKICNM